jgi:arsenate reductase
MPTLTLYHNPRCSKSRMALETLENSGREFTTVLYLEAPPSVGSLEALCHKLGMTPQQLLRPKETVLAELGLSIASDLSRSEWLKVMTENPILIERPIVVLDDKAVVGRPPENVGELLAE